MAENLVHFSAQPLVEVGSCVQSYDHHRLDKPMGLWVSDEGASDGWRKWCEVEGYRLGNLACANRIVLADGARILRLTSAADIDAFTDEYARVPANAAPFFPRRTAIDWPRIAQDHQGILITPYIWARRLDGGANWYYGWDCASGCIWDASAIASITPQVTDFLQAAE